MPKSFSSREFIRRLEADGWQEVRRRGSSHRQFKRLGKPGRVTITDGIRDIKIETLRSIFRQAGWDWPPQD